MSEVEVVRTGNIFYTSWPKGHEWDFVKMKFSRFEPGSGKSQELKAELLVEALGKQPHNTRVTLTAGRSVNEAAKRCNDEIPGIPWGSIMSEACNGVKESYREGEPVIRLADMAETEASQYLLDPFLLQKQANLIYGDGGLGKSWFALYLGVLVATGKSHAGISPEPGNVMYLDYEVPDFDMKSRLAAVCRGLDVPEPRNFLYRYMYDSTVADQERLNELYYPDNSPRKQDRSLREGHKHTVWVRVLEKHGKEYMGDKTGCHLYKSHQGIRGVPDQAKLWSW